MRNIIPWILALVLFVLLYNVGFFGTFNKCLEWDGRVCIQREVNPQSTWPLLKP